jgi:hypothetical protein
MVLVDSIYLRFYIEVRVTVEVGVGTFVLTSTPPKFLPTLTPQPCCLQHYNENSSDSKPGPKQATLQNEVLYVQ